MRIPQIHGLIDRRILLNFRVPPKLLQRTLPAPFRPMSVEGWGIAGICLIRLKELRPAGLPGWCGMASENAAVRVAVEWEQDGQRQQGVYIPRRHTSSRFNQLLGGRVFPGVHQPADFKVTEETGRYQLRIQNRSAGSLLDLATHETASFPQDSLFESLEECSRFFEAGAIGYSPDLMQSKLQGLQLHCKAWQVRPLEIESLTVPLLHSVLQIPPEEVVLDCALLMTGTEHHWEQLDDIAHVKHCHSEVCCY